MGKTSTERSRERREKVYQNRYLHQKLKEQDRNRKNISNRKAAETRKQNENERVLYRLKEREAKRKFRAKQKELKKLQGTEVPFSTPQKSAIKNKMRRLRRSYDKKLTSAMPAEESPSTSNECNVIESSNVM